MLRESLKHTKISSHLVDIWWVSIFEFILNTRIDIVGPNTKKIREIIKTWKKTHVTEFSKPQTYILCTNEKQFIARQSMQLETRSILDYLYDDDVGLYYNEHIEEFCAVDKGGWKYQRYENYPIRCNLIPEKHIHYLYECIQVINPLIWGFISTALRDNISIGWGISASSQQNPNTYMWLTVNNISIKPHIICRAIYDVFDMCVYKT